MIQYCHLMNRLNYSFTNYSTNSLYSIRKKIMVQDIILTRCAYCI